jgi:hypothetical protein
MGLFSLFLITRIPNSSHYGGGGRKEKNRQHYGGGEGEKKRPGNTVAPGPGLF